jgi:hypothetical protein
LRRELILLSLFFSLQTGLIAQSKIDSLDFNDVDSFVLSVNYDNDIVKLAKDLGDPYAEDIYKVRAIFKWITNNIEYDYRFINSGKELKTPDCEYEYENENDCIEETRVWENNYLKKILQRKKAIADGYAKLFKKLCDLNYIQSKVIMGYARTRPYQVGNTMGINHSWNAVMIDADWYYIDVTWAAGYCPEDEETGRLLKYVKDFRNYYWLSPFSRFSRNHYPKKGNFLEPTNLTKEQFFMKPHYYSIDVLENISEEIPSTGVLKVKKGDTIHFKFNYKKDIKLLQVNSNIFRNPSLWTTVQVSRKKTKIVRDTWAEKKQQYIIFKKEGNIYEFDYPVSENSLYYLELVFDYKQAIRYRVRVEN